MTANAFRSGYMVYGLLGLPLAMAALPVYVHIPAFYALHLNVGLVQLGWVLFAARLIDTLQDPFLGLMIDRLGGRLNACLAAAAAVLALAFTALWRPPSDGNIAVWLGVALIMVYSAHSFLSISYLAWGASLDGSAARAKVLLGPAAWREAAGLFGILLASAVPAAVISAEPEHVSYRMAWYSAVFAVFIFIAVWALLSGAPTWHRAAQQELHWMPALRSAFRNQRFKRLLGPYLLNALSVSLPATLVIFYIRDQLRAPELSALFLVAYFAAAVCCLPLWVRIAKRLGTVKAWRIGMILSIGAFAGAGLLGPGDTLPYLAVCLAAGSALGADLALPPVLFAQAIGESPGKGIYFSFYTMLGKLALALTGLALPLLAAQGYKPGNGPSNLLAAVYAGLPCLLKLAAMISLGRIREEVSDLPCPVASGMCRK
ncbi:MFS transporter [Pseudoduganella violaceinigra]|uniref:MFS transporter n=1 Tax=Pseudoduganella violaceinigra TaxID=246602 RepID=UPI000422C6EF|nr:MFS transporter [Pseudoduganella violaceinigra]